MKEDLEQFIHTWLSSLVESSSNYQHRLDNKACVMFVKYLMDEELPSCDYKPTHYELERVYKLFSLLPTSLESTGLKLLTFWKSLTYTDPDQKVGETVTT